jgi:hypothetical protein
MHPYLQMKMPPHIQSGRHDFFQAEWLLKRQLPAATYNRMPDLRRARYVLLQI